MAAKGNLYLAIHLIVIMDHCSYVTCEILYRDGSQSLLSNLYEQFTNMATIQNLKTYIQILLQ
jgi:hypothetical protein